MNRSIVIVVSGAITFLSAWSWAESPLKPAVVPPEFQWVRSLDTEGYVQKENGYRDGIQHVHFRMRYLDPDVNAFIGMQADLDHFNHALLLGDPNNPAAGHFLVDMGAHVGVVRKKTTWELDLMGVTSASKLGPALAVVTEYRFNRHWMYASRIQGDIFTSDGVLDIDQGLCWTIKKSLGITVGFRTLLALHMDRLGPRVGLRYAFDSPKIPFIFPSVG